MRVWLSITFCSSTALFKEEAYDVTPSELGCDAVVGDAHGILHECFLRRLARITGQHCEAIVIAHVLQGFVQVWLMSVRCDDG